MNPIRSGAAAAAAVILLSANSAALAHGWAGQRFFPATILTDDPFVADEISLPQVSVNPPGPDGAKERDIQIDMSKRITPDTGIIISPLRTEGQYSSSSTGRTRRSASWGLM